MLKLLLVLALVCRPAIAAKCKAAPKSVQNIQQCCHAPMPNWGAYNSECSSSGPQPSCRLQCIFNAAKVLDGNRLNMTHVRPMLERAFNEASTIDAYMSNFASCANLVKNNFKEMTGVSKQSDACDRHALFYSLCAYSRLLRHCPSSAWNGSLKQCPSARSYVRNCPWPALKMFMKST
ncbi:uncharacterized protein LOC115634738 [Scaptodrosophila lebanonensis]|uniref:Uncharacterized protein LOC115634738 n=1 Tax=Drosophila lebanonensis TaxID=7225 RepID=A0A6J2UJB1_DROLE|nr:uncharacterized protein LOC115634738 [Scaptodrosophila lebanonensis]